MRIKFKPLITKYYVNRICLKNIIKYSSNINFKCSVKSKFVSINILILFQKYNPLSLTDENIKRIQNVIICLKFDEVLLYFTLCYVIVFEHLFLYY